MKSIAVLLVLFSLALALAAAGQADAAEDDGQVCCPRCRARCLHTVEKEQVSRQCFRVECRWICIPRIRFPWEPCCQEKGAVLRQVKVLKTVEYECEECRHVWKAVCVCPSCQGHCPAVSEPAVSERQLPPRPAPRSH